MKKLFVIIFVLIIFIYIPTFANDELVYVDINNIDTKYHRVTCNHIFPNGYKTIKVEDAFNTGYRRCADCNPPMSDVEYNERLKHAQELRNTIPTSTTSYNNTLEKNDTINPLVYILCTTLLMLVIFFVYNDIKYKKKG